MADIKKRPKVEKKIITDPENSSRRRAVKTIVGGVSAIAAYHTLPTNWSKPIIEQVFLPAHAATSGVALNDPCSVSLVSGDTGSTSVNIRVTGFVTPPTSGLAVVIVSTPVGGSGGPVTANTTTSGSGTFSADITVSGGGGITSVTVLTTVTGASGTASCSVNVPAAATTTPSPSTTPGPTSTNPA